MTKQFAIKVAYLGKNYQGFQRQAESIKTIEKSIFEALIELEIINIISEARYSSAGRTDRGVNAIGQVITFNSLREEVYLEELNTILPNDIYAWAIAEVKENFNARRDALLRTYRFYHYHFDENFKLMKKALKKLEGTHDFAKLCKKADILPSGIEKSTILNLETAKLNKRDNILEFEFASRSFLWNQIRKMVSVILAIGSGKYTLEIIDEILNPQSLEPKGGIKPVPPEGLVLYDVYYKDLKFTTLAKKASFQDGIHEKLNSYSSTSAVLELMKNSLLK
jgi:tRNA pseudouridine38-40 synthase